MFGAADGGYGSMPPQFPEQYGYGQKPMGMPRRGLNAVSVCVGFLVPWFIFMAVFSLQSFSVKYTDPGSVSTLTAACFFIVMLLGYFAFVAWRRRLHGDGDSTPTFYLLTFVTALLGWFAAIGAGSYNFSTNMQPFYDVTNLNDYTSVNPMTTHGQQVMDGGQFHFTPDARLSIPLSMGFRNLDTYCVAPIVAGYGNLSTYDFWAVGINCCAGHLPDFHCGEFANPQAHSGLRLMREDQRAFFRLAVQQAEAAYNIRAAHPLFVYWMQDPVVEIKAYEEAGFKFFATGALIFFAFQLIAVALTSMVSR